MDMARFHKQHASGGMEKVQQAGEVFDSESGVVQRQASFARIITLATFLLVIAVCVAAVHWPALSCESVLFDDHQYLHENKLVQNPGLASARRFLGEVLRPSTVKGYYQPLTMISLMLDYAGGGRPKHLVPFHRTSLALHVVNTMLVVVFVYLLLGRVLAAAAVGLLFGVHPLTVESIPWVAERKTLLAAFLALWCLIFYVCYAKRGSWILWGASGLMYVLALMAKPSAIPVPVLMVLLDYWPLRRLGRRTVLEKAPFFAIGAVFGVLIFISQRSTFGVRTPGEYGLGSIALVLCHNVVFYLQKFIWPERLSSFYPFPLPFTLRNPMILAGVLGTCGLVSALLVSCRWTRSLLIGWLFFFVAIFPTMGVVGFHDMIAADRHAYLPFVGILLVVAYLLCRFWGAAATDSARKAHQAGTLVVIVMLALLEALGTRAYLVHWRDSESLHRRMLALAPEEPILQNSLGSVLAGQGRFDEAVVHYTGALRQKSSVAQALGLEVGIASKIHFNLAGALKNLGRREQAVVHYEMASRLRPDRPDVHNDVGRALAELGMLDEAVAHHTEAIRLKPDYADAYCYRAIALARQGKLDEAVTDLSAAIELKPNYATAWKNLGIARFHQGRFDEAVEKFRRALQIDPLDAETHCNLGIVLMEKGGLDEAIGEFRAALRCDPNHGRAGKLLEAALARKAGASTQ
ncbi:MAG: tetratricopeptide repeat protein [Planctomycetota bacterium]|jgi:Flp pilus assembly protein TadD